MSHGVGQKQEQEEEALQEEEAEPEEADKAAGAVMAEYQIWVYTSSCKDAGTTGRVSIELHGQGGSSDMQPLVSQQNGAFARGQVKVMKLMVACCSSCACRQLYSNARRFWLLSMFPTPPPPPIILANANNRSRHACVYQFSNQCCLQPQKVAAMVDCPENIDNDRLPHGA